jgi:ABC-type transporter Mla subunit MlaD
MNLQVFALLICVALSAVAPSTGAAQGAPSGASASSKPQLAEIRASLRALQGHTDTLRELMEQYRALVERRPEAEGSSADAKKAHEAQLAKWSAALERLLRRIDEAHKALVEVAQRLSQQATGNLPTSLAKDVANARNEADAERATAEQALAKRAPAAPAGKQPPPREKVEASHELDDL